MRWTEHVTCIWERRDPYSIFVENPVGKRKLGRPRHRWKDNVKLNLEEIPCVGCIDLAWVKDKWRGLMNVAMKFRVQYNTGNVCTD
jgi:hypothetical protein